jgi:hypothetical protein
LLLREDMPHYYTPLARPSLLADNRATENR